MKSIKILKLNIENFKKIKFLEIDFDGKNIDLVGKNGVGKTSVFDAFSWVLFGKDSSGATVFNLKPYDPITKKEINGLNTSVEITLDVEGVAVILKRVYKEVWTKKRGDLEATFTGHETEYYVNGVPSLQKDYKAFIDNLITEDLFKMLTNLYHFSNMKWQDQRAELEKVTKVTELEIIDANPELAPIKNELVMGRTVEDVLKIQTREKKNINDRLEYGIPSELNALKNITYPSLTEDFKLETVEAELSAQFEKLANIEKQLATGNNQIQVSEYDSGIITLERDIVKVENERDDFIRERTSKDAKVAVALQDEIYKHSRAAASNRETLDHNKIKVESLKLEIESLNKKKELLYSEYDEEEAKEFTNSNCSYCGQILPQDKLDEAKEHFNLHKSRTLSDIQERGKKLNEEIERAETNIVTLSSEESKLYSALEEINTVVKAKSEELKKLQESSANQKIDVSEYQKRIETLLARKSSLEKARKDLVNKTSDAVLVEAKNDVKSKLELLNTQKSEYNIRLQNEVKVEKLEKEMKDLNEKFEKATKLIQLCEKFRTIQADHIDQDVNKHFKLVQFKLFNQLINGGIDPTCIATLRGVPYPSISTGEKINVGLDIINFIQNVYQISAPIFIDNAEAVSDWLVDTNGAQLIKMYVDPEVNKLEVLEG